MTRFAIINNTVHDMYGDLGPEALLQHDYERLDAYFSLHEHECRETGYHSFADVWKAWRINLTETWNQLEREPA